MTKKRGIEATHPTYTTRYSSKTMDVFNGDVVDYIPKLNGQSNDDYESYRNRGILYNITNRVTAALIGVMTRKEYMLSGIEEPVIVNGMSFQEFVTVILRDILLTGRIGIFVDYDEQLKSPYLIPYNNAHMTNWDDDFIVIQEFYYAPDPTDKYTLITTPRYRELYLDEEGKYKVRVWENLNGQYTAEEIEPLVRREAFTELPFVFATAYDTSRDVTKPILNNMADINLSHFKTSVDLEHGLHFMSLPQPVLAGNLQNDKQVLNIGTTDIWHLTEGSSVQYLEFSGNGMAQLVAAMNDKENAMSSIGGRLLSTKAGVESAEALRIRNGNEHATLISLVYAAESAITQALEYYVQWQGLTTTFEFTMNKDFTSATMSPQDIQALMSLLSAGLISEETFLQRLEDGEVIDDAEEEALKLKQQL